MVVANRYNFSLDQRISIRGFGSRSNFGVRGLKILLDGVPQTLPDGQSQLTNIDFANLERAEVLRGASSSLYGNASGGVISLSRPSRRRRAVRAAGAGAGRDGERRDGDDFYKWQSWTSGRSGNVSGTLSVSQFKADGFRQHSAAEFRQLNAGLDYAISGSTLATLRLSLADSPRGAEPGSAHPHRIRGQPRLGRGQQHPPGADKDAQQHQLSLGLRHFDAAGNEYEVDGVRAAAGSGEPARGASDVGGGADHRHLRARSIARSAVCGSARTARWARRAGARGSPPASTCSACGTTGRTLSPTAASPRTVFLDQREKVTELGPFAQVQWSPSERCW